MVSAPVDAYALSAQQAQLWDAARSGPDRLRAQADILIEGPLDAAALRAAAGDLLSWHEALRTTFHAVPGVVLPVQAVGEPDLRDWREVILDGAEAAREPETVGEFLEADLLSPIDLGEGPLLRLTLVRVRDDLHHLLLTAPSACADARSLEILFSQMAEAYEDRLAGGLPDNEPLQYLDFCAWQEELLAGEGAAPGRAFWYLGGAPRADSLPKLPFERAADGAGPQPSLLGSLLLASAEAAAVEEVTRRLGVSTAPLLLTAWQTLLCRLVGRWDVIPAAVLDGRRHEELRGGVGLYARCLPVTAHLAGRQSFAEAALAVDAAWRGAVAHQEYFAPGEGSAGGSWPFGFEFRDHPSAVTAGGATFSLRRCECRVAPFKAALSALRDGTGIVLELRADPVLYPAAEAERLAARLGTLLRSALQAPDTSIEELELMPDEERRQILTAWSARSWSPPAGCCVHELFEERARRNPEAVAVRAGGAAVSYGELDRRASRLARFLRRLGVGPETPVGLCCGLSADLIVGILGILKAGGAYVPLDPTNPPARQLVQLEDAGAPVLLTGEGQLDLLTGYAGRQVSLQENGPQIETEDPSPPPPLAMPDNLAYVIYTSGSTGSPKGVAVRHASLSRYSLWIARELLETEARPPLGFAMVSTPAADLGNTALFPALISGGCLHLLGTEARDAGRFAEVLRRESIDILKIVPGHLAALLPAGAAVFPLPEDLILGGERLHHAFAERLREISPRSRMINHYGPTEATVGALVHRLDRQAADPWAGSVPIGRPIGGARTYILDAAMRPVPVGTPGELYLGGAGLARGYVGRPEPTAAAFVPDPYSGEPGARLYRTGDLARHLPDGEIEFLGRIDAQIKVRGFRVEPGEVEAVLRSHPGVREAAVLAREERPGEHRLIAFAVLHPNSGEGLQALPGGLRVHARNRHETDFFYRQIFVDETNLRHGISLPEGACVFDVGANIGLFTLFVMERCPSATVYSFEPVPETFELLRGNTEAAATRTRIFRFGLSDAHKAVDFTYYPQESCMSGCYGDPRRDRETLARVIRNVRPGEEADPYLDRMLDERIDSRTLRCEMRTLSEVLEEEGVERIDLLKIDVERSELDVLRGIREADWPKIRQIVIEAHDVDGNLGALEQLLRRQGFRVVVEQDPLLAGTELFNVYASRETVGAVAAPPEARRAPAPLSPPRGRGADPTADELRRFTAERLPDFMVPASFVMLDELPLTANGKLDRVRLAALAARPDPARRAPVPPRTPAEAALAAIWRDVLGVEAVGIDDNFFSLGGDSIRLIQMRYRAEERGFSFPSQQVLEAPTIRELAGLAAPVSPGSSPGTEAFALLDPADRARLPAGMEDAYPLTSLQAGMLFHSAYTEGSAAYLDVQLLRLRGPLDPESLDLALREVATRHPALRTSFDLTSYGQPLQLVHAAVRPPLACADLRGLEDRGQEAALAEWMEREKTRGYDWGRPPLLRTAVFLRGRELFSLGLSTHHAILDGWSNALLLTEWLTLYRSRTGAEISLEPAPEAVFRQLVALEIAALGTGDDERFWQESLQAAPATRLARSLDRSRPAEGRTRVLDVALEDGTVPRLAELARNLGVPLKSVLLAAHVRALSFATGRGEVVTGLVSTRRPDTPGADRALGLFLSTLPLRLRVAPGTWADLVLRVFAAERQMLPHRFYPVERLQADGGREPLFDTVFNFNHFHVLSGLGEPAGLEVLGWRGFEETNFTLTANFHQSPASGLVRLALHVNPNEIDAAQAARLARWYVRTLSALANDPGGRHEDAPLLTEPEAHLLLREWNDTGFETSGADLVHTRIRATARRSPDAVAVVCGEESLTYGALDGRATALARTLQGLGVGPDIPVGLFLEPSIEMVVGIVGTLAAGGAYVPLDPAYPRQRLERILADAAIPVVLTVGRLREALPATSARVVELDGDGLPEADAEGPPLETAVGGNLAYLIYTSGSTGGPKGVMIVHRELVRSLLARRSLYGDRVDVFLLLSSFSFDSSVPGIFGTLCDGGTIVLARADERRDAEALVQLAERHGVSHLLCLPALYAALLERIPACGLPRLRIAIVAGELCPGSLAARHRERLSGVTLYNEYGPTEATVWTSAYRSSGHEQGGLPIGPPIPGVRILLLDASGRPVPPGIAGEIHVSGNLARGYLGRPEVTAERFLPDPFGEEPGGRLYRTGDLGRYRPDGGLEFLGRVDRQVKIRGHRIELEEVESALEQLPEIAEAVVVDTAVPAPDASPADRHRRLVAYFVPRGPHLPSPAGLRNALREKLPDFALPGLFVTMDVLPRLPNGKVDRAALPPPETSEPEALPGEAAPRTVGERLLAEVWKRVLRRDRIGIHDNFFDLGGDSILSLQIVMRAHEAGLRLTPKQVFEHPTIAGLARAVELAPAVFDAEEEAPAGPVPLTPIQRWFFELDLTDPHHWNQGLLLVVRQEPRQAHLAAALRLLVERHDALRLRFSGCGAAAHAEIGPPSASTPLVWADLSALPDEARTAGLLAAATDLHASLDLRLGPLLRAGFFRLGEDGDRLLLIAHHLVTDAVSWQVLLADLEELLDQPEGEVSLPTHGTSFQRWALHLQDYARSGALEPERGFWLDQARSPGGRLPRDFPTGENTAGNSRSHSAALSREETRALLDGSAATVEETLLAALLHVMADATGGDALWVELEGHGREELLPGLDASRTVGWLTTLYPVRLETGGAATPAELLAHVRDQLRHVPGRGIGYGLLRYLSGDELAEATLREAPLPEIGFNYLGQVDLGLPESRRFLLVDGRFGAVRSPRGLRPALLEINCMVTGGRLRTDWTYSSALHRASTIELLAERFLAAVRSLALLGSTLPAMAPGLTLDGDELARVLGELNREA